MSKLLRIDPSWRDWGITILRVVVGVVFVAHGWQKIFTYGLEGTAGAFAEMGIPAAGVAAVLVAAAELLGGMALIAGFLTRFAAIAVGIVVLGAVTLVHLPAGFYLPNGYEFALTLLAASVGLVLTGPGRLAVDNWLGVEKLYEGPYDRRDLARPIRQAA